ncbi:MAG: phosphoethanolamine transferase [Dysgonamonadaceae bacterium]|jgi:glucan phosphoethanolaminetransferase (alkaline phosphatase superfamily)|nr:phosphoethanolamine transferase [Dysgonamonadaceae bacterium]
MKNKKINGAKKEFVWMIILSVVVLLPNIFLLFYGSDALPVALLLFGLSCLFFLLPALFLRKRIFFILHGVFVLLAPLEMAHIYLNLTPATSAFLLSIIDTNQEESFELLSAIKFPLVILFLLWAFYFIIVVVRIKNVCLFQSKRTKWAGIFIFAGAIIAGYAVGYNKKIYPYDLILRTYQAFAVKKEIKKGGEQMKDFKFNAVKKDPVAGKEIYVFVIGETGRYSSYAINGYQRNTSPMLAQTKNVVSYTDFYSEANITSSSLPVILTRASARDYERSYVEKSFVDAFREAGFKTYWIAGQSANNKFIRRISGDADGEYFRTVNFSDTTNFDEQLWLYLDDVLAKNDHKALIVIHTLGSHFRYNYRYPASYEVFKPSLKGAFDYALISAKNKELFVNTYDNSILYTDFFLAKTIRKINRLHAISALVYVADHGENLFDTKENIVFHGGSDYTHYDFHVPFFVWTSDEYSVQYPCKQENIRCNKDEKLSAHYIFYSILDIADITFPGQILSKSIASETLRGDSVRYIINTNMEVLRFPTKSRI